MDKPKTRCMRCEAPIPFHPGAGSRLCPFCGAVNLVREQMIAVPPQELKIDEVFRLLQNGRLPAALDLAERLHDSLADNYRLAFYRACVLHELGQREDAIYALIDLGGMDGPAPLRADAQAKLAEALLAAGRTDEAIQAAERCLELLDGHPNGSLQLARGLQRKGRAEESLKLTEDTLGRLDRPWRITFPARRHQLLKLKAELHLQAEHADLAAAALEELVLTDSAASLDVLLDAVQMLGKIYLEHSKSNTAALDLLRLAAQLDPENRRGLLDDLQTAAKRAGAGFAEELGTFRQQREDLLVEIRSMLSQAGGATLMPEMIAPELDLTLLKTEPDQRTDLLEQTAERMQLVHFDRGTLYPLKNIEDFRRWVVGWRLRDRVDQLRRNRTDLDRLMRLREVHDQVPGRPGSRRDVGSGKRRAARRWLRWALLALLGLLVGAGVFLGLAGDRYLDAFEGTLVKVECIGENQGPPCTLHVAGGEYGRRRFRSRELREEGLGKLWGEWLDGRVRADGTILYPLGFVWGDLDADLYRRCRGKPIAKLRFTLAPICNPDER